jgi:hypothetical protein
MSSAITTQQLTDLRNEFKTFLRQKKKQMGWSDSTADTHSSDAFFALNNNVRVDFWASLVNEESMLVVRDKIREFLDGKKGSEAAGVRANQYLSSLRYLKESWIKNIQRSQRTGAVKRSAISI